MLGWPSPTYPYLLQSDISPIPITLDQTPLIAGFLLEGNCVGALFSTSKLLSSKMSVCIAFCMQFFGWCVMFGASDIFGLMVSRMTIGFGHSFGTGQLKRYIKETCEPELAEVLSHYLPLGINVGVIIIYIIGTFVTFRNLAVFSAVIPAIGVITFGIIPKRLNRTTERRSTIIKNILNNTVILNIADIEKSLTGPEVDEYKYKQLNIFQCLKETRIRNGLVLILLLVFIQQYTGATSNIIYCQIIFGSVGNPVPNICGITYATFFLLATFFSLKFCKDFPRKNNILISCAIIILTTGLMSLYYYLKHDLITMSEHFVWAPLFILLLYNAFHTCGISTVPMYIIMEKIPKRGRNVAVKFQIIHFSISAVISNKIFQILYVQYDITISFAFWTVISAFGLISVFFFMDDYNPEEEKKKNAHVEKRLSQDISKIEITRL